MANITIHILKQLSMTHVAALIIIIISLFSISHSKPTSNGFTTDLIHRDSPRSPLYDPSLSHSQRLVNAIQRSLHRIQRFDSKHSRIISPSADIIRSNGEYLMKYSVGTPPVPTLAIADTGSDIIWMQCKPCLECFNQSLPIFDPKKSSTYKTVPCNNPSCGSVYGTSCNESSSSSNCLYTERYGDGSFTHGGLATDTVTLGGKTVISVPNVVIGCGFENRGVFSGVESGIVGLGGGNASLVGQLGPLAKGRFSYCLVPLSGKSNSSSKLSFGDKAVVSGRRVGSTPLVGKGIGTFYYATLLGISVGDRRLEMPHDDATNSTQEGNIIVDSGTTLTILPPVFYDELKSAVRGAMRLKEIESPTKSLDLCFHTRRPRVRIPKITVHFKGADLRLKQENIFVRLSDVALCLAARASRGTVIYGNLAQTNFLVGYDLPKRTLSFKHTNCAKR